MIGDITVAENIYIACGCTDMRKSIDGLATVVQQQFQLDPFRRLYFCFVGGAGIVSNAFFGKAMVLFFYTSVWRTDRSNGLVMKPNVSQSHGNNSAGLWRG